MDGLAPGSGRSPPRAPAAAQATYRLRARRLYGGSGFKALTPQIEKGEIVNQEMVLIKDGMAYSINVSTDGAIPVSEFVATIQEQMSYKPVMLPYFDMGCACFAQENLRRMYLMYIEPKYRIFTLNAEDGQELKEVKINLPHTYIALFLRGGAIEGGYAFCAKKKITSVKDQLGVLPFPNVNASDGKICEGGAAAWAVTQDPSVTAAGYIEFFLKSNFTPHMVDGYVKLLPKPLQPKLDDRGMIPGLDHRRAFRESFEKWVELSKTGPESIIDLDWKVSMSVEDMITHHWEKDRGRR